MSDCIAAIATPFGAGGLGVIRISGKNAFDIGEKIAKPLDGSRLCEMNGYTCKYGYVLDGAERLDEAVITVFRSPHSYTGENVVELSVHGSTPVLERLLLLCVQAGARLALPGEFTKRAFLNGKMDLAQAESVADLINAQSLSAARSARAVKDGKLAQHLNEIKELLLMQASDAAAWIDFPDEDTDALDAEQSMERLSLCQQKLENLISGFGKGQMIQKGVRTVIVGKPNVGKSTLMNMLCGQNRSIISQIPGTTRDVVTETVQLGQIMLRLADTAGIRETDDTVEKIGVDLALEQAHFSDLILIVLDISAPLDQQDLELLQQFQFRNPIVVCNKTDLDQRLDESLLKGYEVVKICGIEQKGLDELEKAVTKRFSLGDLVQEQVFLQNIRQLECAEKALCAVKEAEDGLKMGVTWDAVGVCVEEALEHMMALTGENVRSTVVEEVFSRFCVGK